MLEIKVNIEATLPDLSAAITELANAIKGCPGAGNIVISPTKLPEVLSDTIPASAPVEVKEVVPVNHSQAVPPVQQPIMDAASVPMAQVEPVSTSVPAMNPPAQPTAPVTPKIDMNALSRAGAGLLDQGKMQDVLAVLGKYGVQVITQLREDQFEAFAADLRSLGAAI